MKLKILWGKKKDTAESHLDIFYSPIPISYESIRGGTNIKKPNFEHPELWRMEL